MSAAVKEYGSRLVAAVAVKAAATELARAAASLEGYEPTHGCLSADDLRGVATAVVEYERRLFVAAADCRQAAVDVLTERVLEILERVAHGSRS